MAKEKFIIVLGSMLAIIALVAIGCSNVPTTPGGGGTGGTTGTLTVNMKDFPLGDKTVESVFVSIQKVEISKESTDGGTFIVVADNTDGASDNDTILPPGQAAWPDCDNDGSSDEGCYDLMELVDSVASIGQTDLEEGTYTQMRLILSADNTIKFENDTTLYPLKIPSGTQTGIKLTGTVEIASGKTTTVTVDFDAQKSVKQQGKGKDQYLMTPVIHIASVSEEGGETNNAPVIQSLTSTPSEVATGGTTVVTVVASDADGDTLSYKWKADYGVVPGEGATSSITYTAPTAVPEGGMDVVTVTVSDGELENEATVGITIR